MINTMAQLQSWVTKDPKAVLDALSQFRLQITEYLTEFEDYKAYTEVELLDARTETDVAKAQNQKYLEYLRNARSVIPGTKAPKHTYRLPDPHILTDGKDLTFDS